MNPYTIESVWHPGFELIMSLETYLSTELHKVVDLGAAWRASVRRQLPREFGAHLHDLIGKRQALVALNLAQGLAWAWRLQPAGSASDFLAWMNGLGVADLYAVANTMARPGEGVPSNLPELRDEATGLLGLWLEHYWSGVDGRIATGLAAAHAALRERIAAGGGMALVEEVSGGVTIKPDASFDHVVLIPQYHARPWNIYGLIGRTVLQYYPVEALPPAAGQPSPRLVRMLRALNEPKRLEMLRLIDGRSRTMTEIAAAVGLTKATVHYHLVLLRAAGLVRVETTLTRTPGDSYLLRRSAIDDLPREIAAYLDASDADVTGQSPAPGR